MSAASESSNEILTKDQETFLFKRQLFQRVSGFIAIMIILSAIGGWAIIYLVDPLMVDPNAVIAMVNQEEFDMLKVKQLAVAGASGMSAFFFMIGIIGGMLYFWSKKEKQYIDIIAKLRTDSQ